ncbi:MAG TPA: hypothetical protein VFN96_00235 [Gemmatimonadales bacterium]|nr:hypothetical protein [Gemmatimonadales bacterium]
MRAKVRSDYQARLTQVVGQLRAFADQIGARLGGLKSQAVEIRQLRMEELETRAEAELRHSVGEYTEEEWRATEQRSSAKIAGFDQELDRLSEEIGRLEEVQGLVVPSARAAAKAPEPEPAEPRRAPATPSVSRESHDMPAMIVGDALGEPSGPPPLTLVRNEPPAPPEQEEEEEAPAAMSRPEAPKFTPRGGAPRPREGTGPARAIPFPSPSGNPGPPDELAFVRSLSLDAAPPSTRLTPNPAPNAAGMFEKEDRPSQVVAKTLKCGECGSLNRPTEWYCERCGAELAAL